MYGERRKSFAPIKAGEEVDVTIESVGAQGDGVAKVKGFVIFVPGTKQGEKVKVKVTKVFKKVGFGEVVGAGSAKEESKEEESSYDESESEESETIEEEEE